MRVSNRRQTRDGELHKPRAQSWRRAPGSGVSRAQLLGFALAVALALLPAVGRAQANEVAAETAPGNRSKTLLEAVLGDGQSEKRDEQSGEERRLDPDRPHFPEATTTVGLGRAILESGYTFTTKGTAFTSHSVPEALLRVGMIADWFEFRVGQNFIAQQQAVGGVPTSVAGAQDLYLGVKLALTEQKGLMPAVAVIPQMTVPTGSEAVTAGKILPGVNVDASWEVIKDLFGIELLVANNLVQGDLGDIRHELATGLTGVYQLTKQLEGFVEWDAFYPTGGFGSAGPRHQAVGGLVYFVTPDFALDARIGAGLNSRSNTFLAGAGFAVRY